VIYFRKGDLLESECDYICHQVNCQGKMNSGIAKSIREKWPIVFQNYIEKCEAAEKSAVELYGCYEMAPCGSDLLLALFHIAVNIFRTIAESRFFKLYFFAHLSVSLFRL